MKPIEWIRRVRNQSRIADILISYPYSLYKRYRSKWLTWYYYDRHSSAEVDPFRLLWIDPARVRYKQNDKKDISQFGYSISVVEDGDWDLLRTPYEDWPIYQAFVKRFEHNKSWEETEWYNETVQRIQESDELIFSSASKKEFDEHCKKIDRVYNSISKYGYKTQKEMMNTSKSFPSQHAWMRFCPELHEVTVNIGRDGEFIFTEGRHRFTIAKILSVKKIPVRVHVRHSEWNDIREQFVQKNKHDNYRYHPDIIYLD